MASPACVPLPEDSGPFSPDLPTASIVIPVFNSEATLERLCAALLAALDGAWRLQIVLVDDASSDGSVAVCRRLHQRHPGVVDCVFLSRNFGEHNAVMAGLNVVRGEACVIMDDDLQNPASEVGALLAALRRGFDVVYVRYPRKRHHWVRNWGSRLHNWMATRALDKPPELYLSSFKALSAFVVREVIRYKGPDPYLDAIVLRTTRNIGTLEVRHETRGHGASGYTTGKLLSLWGNMLVGFSVYPLRAVALLGLLVALAGLGFGVFGTVTLGTPMMLDPDKVDLLYGPRWVIRGCTLLAVCIVGEYIGRIYRHLNRAPQYIVREQLIWPGPARRPAGPEAGA